jgi:anti-anti-sigma factor
VFEIAISSVGTISLSGEMDLATVEQLDAALGPAATEGGPVTLDVAKVTFMDSSALHSILKASQSLGDRGCVLVHGVNPNGMTRKLFDLTKIDEVRNIHVVSHG